MQPEPQAAAATEVANRTQGGPESGGLVRGDADEATSEPSRTSPKVIAIHALTIRGLREAIPGLIGAFAYLGISGGLRSFGILGIIAAVVAAVVGLATLNWYRFSYQVANRQLIIAQGIFSRRVRTIPVDRIRAIDSQVSPLHRLLRLARLKIEAAAAGTGEEEAVIDGLSTETAHALRESLLRARRRPPRTTESPSGQPEPEDQPDEPIGEIEYARARPSWLLYAPLVGSYLALPLAAVGFLTQFTRDLPDSWFSWLSVDTQSITAGQVVLVVAGALALLALGAVIGAVVLNWRFRLVKRSDLLISERGLFTRRTVSVEIARMRGYTLSEGLGMRLVRAAHLTALITGVSNANSRSQLLPLGPRSEAIAVAKRAVRGFDAPWRRHPVAALRRRLVRSVLPGVAVLIVGVLIGVTTVIVVGAVLTVLGIALGVDRYRSLGHSSDGAAFAVRSGSLVRQTTVMERRAVVGWKVRQSYFQKRAGLSTVTALVGAGSGAYAALDADSSDALGLAANNGGRWARELLP
ncbi:MAG: PH domain-containing protein [Actinomycetota bacterium]|nr:PH domain-containing protein [Actinomycetota bacterium]